MADPVGPSTTTTNQFGQQVTTTPMSDGTTLVVTRGGGSDGGDRPWTKTETIPAAANGAAKPAQGSPDLNDPELQRTMSGMGIDPSTVSIDPSTGNYTIAPVPTPGPSIAQAGGLTPGQANLVPGLQTAHFDPGTQTEVKTVKSEDGRFTTETRVTTGPGIDHPIVVVTVRENIDPAGGLLPSVPGTGPTSDKPYYVSNPNGTHWDATQVTINNPNGDRRNPQTLEVGHWARQIWILRDESGTPIEQVDVIMHDGIPYSSLTRSLIDPSFAPLGTKFDAKGNPESYFITSTSINGVTMTIPVANPTSSLGASALTAAMADPRLAGLGGTIAGLGLSADLNVLNSPPGTSITTPTGALVTVNRDGLTISANGMSVTTKTEPIGPDGRQVTHAIIDDGQGHSTETVTVHDVTGNGIAREITYGTDPDPTSKVNTTPLTISERGDGFARSYSPERNLDGTPIPGQYIYRDGDVIYRINTLDAQGKPTWNQSVTKTVNTGKTAAGTPPRTHEIIVTVLADGTRIEEDHTLGFPTYIRLTTTKDGKAKAETVDGLTGKVLGTITGQENDITGGLSEAVELASLLVPNIPRDAHALANPGESLIDDALVVVDALPFVGTIGRLGKEALAVGRAAIGRAFALGMSEREAQEAGQRAIQRYLDDQRGVPTTKPESELGTGNPAHTQPEANPAVGRNGQPMPGAGTAPGTQALPGEATAPGEAAGAGSPGIANTPGIESPRAPADSMPWEAPGPAPGKLPSTSPLSPALQELERTLGIDTTAIVDAYVAEQMARLDAVLLGIETREPALAGVVNSVRNGIRAEAEGLGLGGAEARAAGGAAHEGGLGTPSGGTGGRGGGAGGGGGRGNGGPGPGGHGPGGTGPGGRGPHEGGSEPRAPYTGPPEEAPYGVIPEGVKINKKGQWYDPSTNPPRPVGMPDWAKVPPSDFAKATSVRRSELDFDLSPTAQQAMNFTTSARMAAANKAGVLRGQRDLAARELGIEPENLTQKYLDEHSAALIEEHGPAALEKLERAMSSYNIAENTVNQLTGEMGMIAARDYIRSMGGKVITGLEGTTAGAGTLDVVGIVDGRLVVVEAKGGNATLGARWVEGDAPGQLLRVQQGTQQYLEWMLRNDDDLRAALEKRGLLDDVMSGKIAVDYDMVRMPHGGRPQVSQFDVTAPAEVPQGAIRDPQAVDPGTGGVNSGDTGGPQAADIAASTGPVTSVIGQAGYTGSLTGETLAAMWGSIVGQLSLPDPLAQMNANLAALSRSDSDVLGARDAARPLVLQVTIGQFDQDFGAQQDGRKAAAYMPR